MAKRQLHINPLKLHRVKIQAVGSNKETVVEKEEEQSMPFKDAALVSFILTLVQYFTVFLALKGYSDISGAPMVFLFDSIKCLGAAFFSNFVVLAGLSKYTALRAAKKE